MHPCLLPTARRMTTTKKAFESCTCIALMGASRKRRNCHPQDHMYALGMQAEQVLHTGVSGAGVTGRRSSEEGFLPGDTLSYSDHRHTLLWHAPSG